jgi:aminopeptidase
MQKTKLKQYARLVAEVGANVQPGQEVFIGADLDQPAFVAMLVEACYRRKAKKVVVEWNYQPLQKLHYRYQDVETLGQVPAYEEARWAHYAEQFPVRIYVLSEDPDGLKGIDQRKMALAQQARYPVLKPYKDRLENKYQWCIVAVPGEKWAKKLFPHLRVHQAVEKMWETILDICRVWDDPVEEWDRHNRSLKDHCAVLNSLQIEKLHYTSANGTDFTVGMIPQARFCGGSETTLGGVTFNPNMPTEECFISPMRGQAEGIVYGTKPLCYHGQLVEGFWIRFHEGRAVEWHADQNESLLTEIIQMDEGSAYLGECALVPYESPICKSGLIFYNTLFDENAVCHLALGQGFADTIEDFHNRTLEECRALGVNESMVHEDFMIGSPDLQIDAICAGGQVVPVFRNGTWAF